MTRDQLARRYHSLSAYERGQAIWRGDPRAVAHVSEIVERIEHELRAGTGRFVKREREGSER